MTRSKKPIVCCGFTPCVQRIIEFDHFETEKVNRATSVTIGIGGKGANTARMVTQLDGTPELIGFSGGANGRLLEEMLGKEGVVFRHVEVEGETRICQTLLVEGHEGTELVEEMPPISPDEWERMVVLFKSLELVDSFVTISGKLPAGAPTDAYAQIAMLAGEQGAQVILDAPGEPLLQALEHQPFIVKINDIELLQTCGGTDIMKACRELIQRGAQSVLITRGRRSVFYLDEYQAMEIFPPEIDMINSVGSGDAVTAGLVVELSRGKEVFEGIMTGMACGAANALNLLSGMLDPDDVERLRPEVRINPVQSR